MWVYQQSSGNLFRSTPLVQGAEGVETSASTFIGKGYSGNGRGLNNPQMQDVHDVGPVPQGDWLIGKPYDHSEHGPHVMALTPEPGTETFGRSGFLIHGDLVDKPGQFLASKGCVILARWMRERISQSGDFLLRVIA